jgi:hypothetical protein
MRYCFLWFLVILNELLFFVRRVKDLRIARFFVAKNAPQNDCGGEEGAVSE